MDKAFHRIESGVAIVIGKPTTWLLNLIWIACWLCFAQTCRFVSWLRQRFAKRKGSGKPAAAARGR